MDLPQPRRIALCELGMAPDCELNCLPVEVAVTAAALMSLNLTLGEVDCLAAARPNDSELEHLRLIREQQA